LFFLTKDKFMKIYFGLFNGALDVIREFRCEIPFGIEFIYASYDVEGYEGYAHVIYRLNGKLYEVNGSHCSCYGLEGQWSPEENDLAALLLRPNVADAAKANLKELYKNLIVFI